jgi:uncharacterized protein (TIGR00661 family)
MKVLYAVCCLGLGHATRSLPIVRKLIDEGHELTIVTSGGGLALLQKELADQANYIDYEDYPIPYTSESGFILKMFLRFPNLINSIYKEHEYFLKIIDNGGFDLVISDNRYGAFKRNLPSFLITHQLRLIAPKRLKFLENTTELFNKYIQKYFKAILVPDFPENDISGDLCHNLNRIDESTLNYIGALSDFSYQDLDEDIDYLFSISGPEPQRKVLEKIILNQVNQIEGNIVVSLGNSNVKNIEEKRKSLRDDITFYAFLPGNEREEILNRSKFIISRSGYSTITDLYVLNKKAFFIPTPEQTEQEYLALYHKEKGEFDFSIQEQLDLEKALPKALEYTGPDRKCDVKKSVENVFDVIFG